MTKSKSSRTNWHVLLIAMLSALLGLSLGVAIRHTPLGFYTPGFICVALIWYSDPGGAPGGTTILVYHFANAIAASGISVVIAILHGVKKPVEQRRLPDCPICGFCIPYPTKPDCPNCGQVGAFASFIGDDCPRPKCERCGFDLSGSISGVCPECGEVYC